MLKDYILTKILKTVCDFFRLKEKILKNTPFG